MVNVFVAAVLLMAPETVSVSPLFTVAVVLSANEIGVEIVAAAAPEAMVMLAPLPLPSKVRVLPLLVEMM